MANKNILEVAFSKIQENEKTELSNHKIDLALIDDVNNSYRKAFDIWSGIESPLLKQLTVAKKSIDLFQEAVKVAEEGSSYAKKLGDSSFIKLFETRISEAKEGIKMAQNTYSAINKAITSI